MFTDSTFQPEVRVFWNVMYMYSMQHSALGRVCFSCVQPALVAKLSFVKHCDFPDLDMTLSTLNPPSWSCRYTSLDGATDTHPNPALLLRRSPRPDGHAHSKQGSNSLEANHDNPDTGRYSPAYMLSDEGLERAGRNDQTTH